MTGTLVPLSALSSTTQNKKDQGTLETGILFLDWLKKTKQSGWQMLPLSETQLVKGSSTKHVPSPYKGYGVGLDPKYLGVSGVSNVSRVSRGLEDFVSKSNYWINDYALFCALRDHFKTDDWREWDEEIKNYTPKGIRSWTKKLTNKIEFYKKQQCMLHVSYQKLRAKAKENKISLIGDLPYYMSLKSPLVWANQELFKLEKGGKLLRVSGSLGGPKARFSRQIERQVWGHPLYKWRKHGNRTKILNLFKMRLLYHSALFDMVRLDYAKAFFHYTSIDLSNKHDDRFIQGPGDKAIRQLAAYSRKIRLPMYMEDTGNYVYKLHQAMEKYSLPGIKIFRYSYNENFKQAHLPYANIASYPANVVAYTTTHDTETLMGYLSKLSVGVKNNLAQYVGKSYTGDDKVFAKAIRTAIINSPAKAVIIPIQDWLLTTDRINIPGTEKEVNDQNWQYKVKIPIEDLPIVS